MTADPLYEDAEMADLLPDDLMPAPTSKGAAIPVKRTAKQQKLAERRAEIAREEADLRAAQDAKKAAAARLAQIVNLHIAGYSLAEIGASIGMTEDEVDRMLMNDVQRYVKTQPALRTYVRNWISERYAKMIEADYDIAVDKNHSEKLENQDRVMRMLDKMGKLHGADAPVQSEVKIDHAPEAVERLVAALAAQQGVGYDENVFDVEIVEDVVEESHKALEAASHAVEEGPDEDL